jgi:hypothetical protein
MYGIDKKADFLLAKNNQAFEGQELCVQVVWPHIVAHISRFGCTETGEQYHQIYLSNKESKFVVASEKYRLYAELIGTLTDARRDRIEERVGLELDEYVQMILGQMLSFYEDQMTDKQKYGYSRERMIVPDDYFKLRRKALREGRAEPPIPAETL